MKVMMIIFLYIRIITILTAVASTEGAEGTRFRGRAGQGDGSDVVWKQTGHININNP